MKFLFEFIVLVVFAVVAVFLYQEYSDDIRDALFHPQDEYTMYVGDIAVSVTIADEPNERKQGLSGTQSLDEFEGKLFIFEKPGKYGFWMKDMLFPVDIFWIDDTFQIVHIEENVSPETYPKVFTPDTEARFVLEVNESFAHFYNIHEGERVIIPTKFVPSDIRADLLGQ